MSRKIKFKLGSFDIFQIDEILAGLRRDIDVSIYADQKYDQYQMHALLKGIELKKDITEYRDPKFDDRQMNQILRGMIYNVDASLYADPRYSHAQMEILLDALRSHIDVKPLLNPCYPASKMRIMYDALLTESYKMGLPFEKEMKESNPDYTPLTSAEIHSRCDDGSFLSKFNGCNVPPLKITDVLDPDIYTAGQLKAIWQGLRHHLDPKVYTDRRYNGDQMLAIQHAMEAKVSYEKLCNPEISSLIMNCMLEAELSGIDMSKYDPTKCSRPQYKLIMIGKLCNIDVSLYDDIEHNDHIMMTKKLSELTRKKLLAKFESNDIDQKFKELYDYYVYYEDCECSVMNEVCSAPYPPAF